MLHCLQYTVPSLCAVWNQLAGLWIGLIGIPAAHASAVSSTHARAHPPPTLGSCHVTPAQLPLGSAASHLASHSACCGGGCGARVEAHARGRGAVHWREEKMRDLVPESC